MTSEPSFSIPLKKSDVVRQTKTHLETLEASLSGVPPCLRTQKTTAFHKCEKEKPRRDAVRELTGIFDVRPEDEDYEDTVRNANW